MFLEAFVLLLSSLFAVSSGEAVSIAAIVTKPGACSSNQEALNEIRYNVSAILAELTSINHHPCGGPGWRRVGYLDLTDPSHSCPPGLALKIYSPGLRSCGRASSSRGCWSTFFNNTGAAQYSRVCGRVRGYQYGTGVAFNNYVRYGYGLNREYVDGVSLSHGESGNRTHIWTFAVSLSEVYDYYHSSIIFCRCATTDAPQPPPFVGNDYFCESGLHTVWPGYEGIFYGDDPLWDGQNCTSSCCEFNNPPYFTQTLPIPTSDDIELRICAFYNDRRADFPIDQVELYVQ